MSETESIGGETLRSPSLRVRRNRPVDVAGLRKRYQQLRSAEFQITVSDAPKPRVFDRPRNVYFPKTVSDTSEAACDTEFDARTYKMLANLDPRERLFLVYNPATRLPDDAFTKCVIERYRKKKNHCNSSVQASGVADEVLAANVQVLQK